MSEPLSIKDKHSICRAESVQLGREMAQPGSAAEPAALSRPLAGPRPIALREKKE